MIELKNTIKEISELLEGAITPGMTLHVDEISKSISSATEAYNKVIGAHSTALNLINGLKVAFKKDIAELEETRAKIIYENEIYASSRKVADDTYNSQISLKRATVESLDTTISELSVTIASKNKENDGLLAERSQLTTEIADLQGQLTNNRRMVAESEALLAKANANKDAALNELNSLNAEIEGQTVKLNRINLAIAK